ncbi:helix-turn-helix domain-containing protein [Thalassospira mesophila]|uniref:XRE family transcriptional regulator n=1 Tax=Thalassospira mesophila TaxID=1293891 RepID=A0A1Y2KWD0_9PROT|nr:XRE family transcriptional regulator [Thalassospira mesophila]OSQ36424.1 XRE family transcriptional regulator [Thalassospira mesophila]
MKQAPQTTIDQQIATRLKALRQAQGWTLDDLASQSGISKSTLSRLEKAEVSPTTALLAKLCATHQITLSRLMHLVEATFEPLIRRADQKTWKDNETGFTRRSLSPPTSQLDGEVLECIIPPDTTITYAQPPKTGLEHHLVMQEGELTLIIAGAPYELTQGDCLRYQLTGSSSFQTPRHSLARYHLFIL